MAKYAVYDLQYHKQHYNNIKMHIKPQYKDLITELARRENVSVSRLIIEALEDVYGLDLHTRRQNVGE